MTENYEAKTDPATLSWRETAEEVLIPKMGRVARVAEEFHIYRSELATRAAQGDLTAPAHRERLETIDVDRVVFDLLNLVNIFQQMGIIPDGAAKAIEAEAVRLQKIATVEWAKSATVLRPPYPLTSVATDQLRAETRSTYGFITDVLISQEEQAERDAEHEAAMEEFRVWEETYMARRDELLQMTVGEFNALIGPLGFRRLTHADDRWGMIERVLKIDFPEPRPKQPEDYYMWLSSKRMKERANGQK